MEDASIADYVASSDNATNDEDSFNSIELEENIADTVASIDNAYEEGRKAIEEGNAVLNEMLVPEVVMDDATALRKRSAGGDLKKEGGTRKEN